MSHMPLARFPNLARVERSRNSKIYIDRCSKGEKKYGKTSRQPEG